MPVVTPYLGLQATRTIRPICIRRSRRVGDAMDLTGSRELWLGEIRHAQ
jgi:hypothetical protein